ncbi:MAG TPA: CHAT domain-containing protein [Nocardioidaceae bacterium]|nr:CHAT domain-containing protein [Nocardioidaceae bacterium]
MTDSLPVYEELQLRVRPGQRGGYRVEAVAPDGSRASGTFRLPVDETQLDNFVLQVGQPRRNVRKFRSPQMERAKEFGGRLFDALVAEEVRDLYRAARSGADARGYGLRVTLCLTEVPTLMSVPWEFLFERPSFLAQSIYTPLVRSLDLKYVRRPPPVALPLHILGMVSRPKGVTALDVDGEQRRLADALAPLSEAGLVRLEWLPRATLSELHEAVSRPGEIHVLHYIGHGAYDERTESGILLLEDDDGLRHEVTGEELGTLLQDEHSLRLVVLNSCEGARTSHVDPFSGVASSLVEVGIPAVISMQFEITDEAAVTFGGSLYKALVQGYPVDAALAQVRKAIFAARHDVEFGTPVLFLRATDAHLFDFQEATPLPEQVAPETAECDVTVDLVQSPAPTRSGEQITWQLTIANTGGCTLEEITARDESGDQLAPPVRLTPGTRHIVRWRETAEPDAHHLITVTARAPDGSTISEQTTASTSATIEETAESTHPAGERVPTADRR